MSWDSYVEDQLMGQIDGRFAVIAGLDDKTIWASCQKDADQRSVTDEEIETLIDNLTNDEYLFTNGIRLSGEKYICLMKDTNLIRARNKNSALAIVWTKSMVLICASADGFPAGQLNLVVEKLADFLLSHGM